MFDEMTDMSVIRPRIERIRAWLEAKNLGALFVYSPAAEHKWGQTAHVAYLTGWANHDRIVDSAVVVPVEGDPVLMFAGLPYMLEQIEQVSPITDVRLVKAVDPNAVAMDTKTMGGARAPGTFAEEAVAIMRENEIFNERVGVVGVDNMPVPFYEHLHADLGDNLVRGDDIVAELRAVKTPEELELIRHAARLGDIGFQTMVDVARPGMRGIEIVAEMEHAVRKAGADHAKYWMGSGPDTKWEDTRLDIRPHLRVLQRGRLHEHLLLHRLQGILESRPARGHPHAPQRLPCRTSCRRPSTPRLPASSRCAPAIALATSPRPSARRARLKGWTLLGGRVGHGIGMDYSERPSPCREQRYAILEAGNTIILHSAFALPGSGKMFVPIGDHMHVGEDGPEFLMGFERGLFVAGE